MPGGLTLHRDVSVLCRIDIWNATQHITENVAFFLPKNANIDQVLTVYYYTVFQKKGDTKLMAVTLSFLNRFSKFFH